MGQQQTPDENSLKHFHAGYMAAAVSEFFTRKTRPPAAVEAGAGLMDCECFLWDNWTAVVLHCLRTRRAFSHDADRCTANAGKLFFLGRNAMAGAGSGRLRKLADEWCPAVLMEFPAPDRPMVIESRFVEHETESKRHHYAIPPEILSEKISKAKLHGR